MRVISGIKRGKKLLSLEGTNTRPTLDRVKISMFNIIQFDIQNAFVLDLFSGSGQLGIECISRGAKFCHFNDMAPKAVEIIKKNINACDFDKISQVTCKNYVDCVKILNRENKKFDLIFLDPPYNQDLISKSLDLICENDLIKENTLFICESARDEVISLPKSLTLVKEYFYGIAKISVLRGEN